jgi:hypothetical protein
MEDNIQSSRSSKLVKILFYIIILILIPVVLLLLTKPDITSKINIPDNPLAGEKTQEFDSKYFALKYPSSFKEEKSTPETGTLELKSVENNGGFKMNVTEYESSSIKGDKTPLENVMDEAILRERPYYAEYAGKTKIKGFDTLIFSTDKPKDPATQKELPPLTAYYVYVQGEKSVKVVKIIYFGNEKESLQFEQLIDEIILKPE